MCENITRVCHFFSFPFLDKNFLSSEMKILAEELNKLKAEFLEDLRQGNNQKYQVWLKNSEFLSKATTSFQQESDNIVKKYVF